jgi:outer membrane protein assembly factor BamA
MVICLATPLEGGEDYITQEAERAEAAVSGLEEKNDGDFIFAPIPLVNPTLGYGLIGAAAYLKKLDPDSQASYVGAGGMYAEGGSWALGLGGSFNFKADTWKLKGGLAYFDVTIPFYGIGNDAGGDDQSIDLNEEGWAVGVKGLRRIAGDWYAGLSYRYAPLTTSFDSDTDPTAIVQDPPVLGLGESTMASLGLVGERDSRDSQFAATRGSFFQLTWSVADELVGSDFDFQSIKASYNLYRRIKKDSDKMIIAGRASACATPGDTPFYALCKFGQSFDLRGYVGGRYRDKAMLAIQTEFRWSFSRRWGAVGFIGVGGVSESLSDFDAQDSLPAAGVGVRFSVSPENRLNISLDWAVGKDDNYVYIYVGEAF